MKRYTFPAIALHWVQAAVVLWLFWLGWTMVDLPKGAERSAAYGLHKSLGLLALGLLVLRLAWRAGHPPPPSRQQGGARKLATAVHHLLYAFLLLAPLAGYLASAFGPYPVKFFGVDLPRIGGPDPELNALGKQAHAIFVWSGAGLVALHAAGALVHAWRRDGTLARMLPGGVFKN